MSVYNGGKYLRLSIDSILEQALADFEFLIVDDASTDHTPAVLDSCSDPRIRILRNRSNLGLTRSLNRGLAEAGGEYVARMDAEDISLPARLLRQSEFLDSHPAVGVVGSHYAHIDRRGKVVQIFRPPGRDGEIRDRLWRGNPLAHGSVMFRKEVIQRAGGYRREFRLAQDYDLWLRLADVCRMAVIPEVLYQWRINLDARSVKWKVLQDRYAALAVELARQRRREGRDSLQTGGNAADVLDSRTSRGEISRKEIGRSYYLWGRDLYNGRRYRESLKFLLLSLLRQPFSGPSWSLLVKDLVLWLFPESLTHRLKRIKSRHRHPGKTGGIGDRYG